ncbi:hypothetical protein AB0O64_23395 [Streptomyces sp. NPDC088341]|uniref:hypothetical protein n=1 Tax=Streptomyces sp. NPDC088341 TaxID=3154870 RepID=UPI0034285E6A
MGAALHLAHAEAPVTASDPRRKKGGGGGGGYDALVRRVYGDRRHTPQSRELILLLAWLLRRDPARVDADGAPVSCWARAREILGEYKTGPYPGSRLADLLFADRPRYEPDHRDDLWQQRRCAAPMIRREGLCGHHAIDHSISVDPGTGWHTPLWYCRRHSAWGHQHDAARRAAAPVEPVPNRGGMLPAYLVAKNGDESWAQLYRDATTWKRGTWKRPVKYGLSADGWPTPGVEPTTPRARLYLAALDGTLLVEADRGVCR